MSIDPFSVAVGALVASAVWWLLYRRRTQQRPQRATGAVYECTVCEVSYPSRDDARGHAKSKHNAVTEQMAESIIRVVE